MKGYSPLITNQAQGGYPAISSTNSQSPGAYSPNTTINSNPQIMQMNQLQPNFMGINYQFVTDPMIDLASSTEAIIHQKPQFAEQLFGCQFPNRYYVLIRSPQSVGYKMLFKCKEQSECCQRNCCPASWREFLMDLIHIKEGDIFAAEDFSNPYVRAVKPFKCTCFCLERPEMNVFKGGNLEGIVRQPWSCCDPIFTIHDKSGVLKYYIYANCCQCGYCCANNFFGKFSDAIFNIYKEPNMGVVVGSIVKKSANLEEALTNADSYAIAFPSKAEPNDKLLLILTALMIDYQFFENRKPPETHNNRHYV